MATRIITFHRTEPSGNEVRMSPPAFYIERDYTPIACRVYAEDAPLVDAYFDIFDDGTSIFNNRSLQDINWTTGKDQTADALTAQFLGADENSDDSCNDFTNAIIESGSWLHANLKCGGGRNFLVQLELYSSDDDEPEDE